MNATAAPPEVSTLRPQVPAPTPAQNAEPVRPTEPTSARGDRAEVSSEAREASGPAPSLSPAGVPNLGASLGAVVDPPGVNFRFTGPVRLNQSDYEGLRGAFVGDGVDLNRVTPGMISGGLDASQRQRLMGTLSETRGEFTHPQAGVPQQQTLDGVFAARMSELEAARGLQGQATAGLYAASPESFPSPRSMDDRTQQQIAGNLASVIRDRLNLERGEASIDTVRDLGEITGAYLARNPGSVGALTSQAQRGLQGVDFPDARTAYTNSGRVLGSLAAGIQQSGQSPSNHMTGLLGIAGAFAGGPVLGTVGGVVGSILDRPDGRTREQTERDASEWRTQLTRRLERVIPDRLGLTELQLGIDDAVRTVTGRL
ncbi:hypothetical protein JST97_18970 [bacterium]|nr:hypothetical protein [bacterium]